MSKLTRRDLFMTTLAGPAIAAASTETSEAQAEGAAPPASAPRERPPLDFGWGLHLGHGPPDPPPPRNPPGRQAGGAAPPASAARERLLMDFGWRFHLGHAADASKDFDFRGNFSNAYNLGSFSTLLFDDRDRKPTDLPHDWAIDRKSVV